MQIYSGRAFRRRAAGLSACVTPLGIETPLDLFQNPDISDLGPEPTSYEQLVRAYMISRLVDSESAQYDNWQGPRRGDEGYIVSVTINDKDALGKYSGPKQYVFVLRNDQVVSGSVFSP